MKNIAENQSVNNELIANLQAENAALKTDNEAIKTKLQALELSLIAANKLITGLQEQCRLYQTRLFGKKSETSKQLELEQVFDEELPPAEPEPELSSEPEKPAGKKRPPKTVGRKIDTSKLPCRDIIYDLPEAQRICACGQHLVAIGTETTEQLEYIPATLRVIKSTTVKYACRQCDKIITAPKPEAPIPKCLATASLIADVIIKKYEHHLPWYRQAKIFSQQGIDLPANTICNWFLRAGEVLEPLGQALFKQLTAINVLQADETPVKMLEGDFKGYMWCYHSLMPNNHFLLFEYNDSRSGEVVNNTLQEYAGILQTDAYGGYNQQRQNPKVICLGCWAHARRKFAEVVKIAKTAGTAHEMVKLIGKLYQIEQQARALQLDAAQRQALRQAEAILVLDKIKTLMDKANPSAKSALGQALTYLRNQWEYLIKYVDYGQAEIDNNLCENQIRPFAIGKKNWMFLGNERSAKIAAFFYSIIQTCRLNNIDPASYLIYVLSQAGKMRRKEIDPVVLLPQFIDQALLK